MIEAIIAQRGSANRQGPEFVDVLLEGRASMVERGRVELDRAEPASTMSIVTIYLPNIAKSDIIEVIGSEFGPRRVGIVTSFQHQVVRSTTAGTNAIPVGARTRIEAKLYDPENLTGVSEP